MLDLNEYKLKAYRCEEAHGACGGEYDHCHMPIIAGQAGECINELCAEIEMLRKALHKCWVHAALYENMSGVVNIVDELGLGD